MQPTGRYLGGEAALDADVREEVALDIEVASRPRPDSSSLLFSRSPSIRAKSRLTAAYAALNRLEKQLNFEENKPGNNEAVVAKLDAELDAVDAMLDAAAASLAVVTADGQSRLIEDKEVQKYLDLVEVEKTAQQAEGMELEGASA